MESNEPDINVESSTSRRAFLAGVGAVAGLALSNGRQWLGSDIGKMSFDELFSAFVSSLTTTQRAHTFLASDHPARQVTLTQAVHQGPHIGTLFNGDQVALIRAMYEQVLSSQGRAWLQNTVSLEGRFEGSILKIYSQDANQASVRNSQVVINGGHYMLRTDDLNDGYALGGPVSYGQQLGNNKFRVQGNAFKAHGDAIDLLHAALSDVERQLAYQDSPPQELLLQTQGVGGVFPGVRIGDISSPAQEVAREALNTLFAGFTLSQQSEAWSAIEDNGGIGSLHLALYQDFSFYTDGTRFSELSPEEQKLRGNPYTQIWRIEGPASVIHFKGYPHVHAYMNIVKDPSKIAIGESLTTTKQVISQAETQRLVMTMLKANSEQTAAFYPSLVQGRISPGIVSTGSIYTLDPFANEIVTAELAWEAMAEPLKQSLYQQGFDPNVGQRVRIATIDYMLQRPDLLGTPERVNYSGQIVRDQLIEFVTDKDIGRLLA